MLCFPSHFVLARVSGLQKKLFFLFYSFLGFMFFLVLRFITLRSLAAQCIVIGPVCGRVCNGRAGGVCYHDNPKLRASIFTKLGL